MLFADMKFLAEQFQLELNSLKVHFTTIFHRNILLHSGFLFTDYKDFYDDWF